MYFDIEDWDTEDGFEIFTGTALEMFLKVDPRSLTFRRYVYQISKSIRQVYPNYRQVNFNLDTTKYKTFLSELKGFLKDMDCPYKEFTSACIELAIQNKHCRRRILNFLNSEYISAMKINNFFLKQIDRTENSSFGISRDTPGTSSCTNDDHNKLDDEETVPNNKRKVGPGEEQSFQIPQVVYDEAAKKECVGEELPKKSVEDEPTKKESLENKLGELTIDTQQPSQSLIPTLQQNYATQVHRSTGVPQYSYSDNNQQWGSMQSWVRGNGHHNIRPNQNILPNQQQAYRPPAFNHTFNFGFPRPPYLPSNQAVRPIQTDWINPLNQNSQGIWNSQIHCNEGFLQGANQNRGLNDNIRYNLNHQWHPNVPSPYSHNQNLNIPQQQAITCPPEYWNTRGSGNIPITQNNQQGWISQGPRNTGLPLFGNNVNDQQVVRVQGGEYQNPRFFGNVQHQLNNQQSYRPPANHNINIPRQQETFVSHGDGANHYITNISIYQGQEGENGQSGITGVLPSHSGMDNRIQRRGNMPHGEYQNPSSNSQNTKSQSPRP